MAKLHPQLGKIGFVLGSGFLRGAFQVGALKAFHEARFIPSYIVGSSAGAINGAAFAAGKMDLLVKTYEEIAKHPHRFVYRWNFWVLLRALFWSKSLLVNTPLRHAVIEARIGLQELISSPVKVDILTTDFQDAKEVIFSNHNPEHQNPELLTEALLASAAIPVVFPPFRHGDHQLFDGAVIEKTPITLAIREGCDTIFVITTDAQDNIREQRLFTNIYAIARRAIQLVSWRALGKDLERGREINSDIQAHERLQHELAAVVEERVADPAARAQLHESIRSVLGRERFSFQQKRFVRTFVIEPDPEERDEPERPLNYRNIPQLLLDGHEKAQRVLRQLELI